MLYKISALHWFFFIEVPILSKKEYVLQQKFVQNELNTKRFFGVMNKQFCFYSLTDFSQLNDSNLKIKYINHHRKSTAALAPPASSSLPPTFEKNID